MLALHMHFVLQDTQNSIMLYSMCDIILTVERIIRGFSVYYTSQQQILIKTVKREKEMAFITHIK